MSRGTPPSGLPETLGKQGSRHARSLQVPTAPMDVKDFMPAVDRQHRETLLRIDEFRATALSQAKNRIASPVTSSSQQLSPP